MSSSLFVKCLTGVSVVGVASATPALYSFFKTSNSTNLMASNGASGEMSTGLGAQSRNSGVPQEVLLRDQQHDDCVRRSAMVRVKDKQTQQEKEVTLEEFLKKHKEWEIVDNVAKYEPKCSRTGNPEHK